MSLTAAGFFFKYILMHSHHQADGRRRKKPVHGRWFQRRKERDKAPNTLTKTLNKFNNNRNGHNSDYSIFRYKIFGLTPLFTLFYNFWAVISSTHGFNREKKCSNKVIYCLTTTLGRTAIYVNVIRAGNPSNQVHRNCYRHWESLRCL